MRAAAPASQGGSDMGCASGAGGARVGIRLTRFELPDRLALRILDQLLGRLGRAPDSAGLQGLVHRAPIARRLLAPRRRGQAELRVAQRLSRQRAEDLGQALIGAGVAQGAAEAV